MIIGKEELNDKLPELIEHFTPLDLPDTAGSSQHPAVGEDLTANQRTSSNLS